MRLRAAIAATACLLIGLAGCSPDVRWHAPNPSASASAAAGTLDWHSCRADAIKANPQLPATLVAECATLAVPRDWRTAVNGKDPDGRTFDIALIRLHNTAQTDRIGSVLLNPGGPGGSGFDFAAQIAPQLGGLTSRFDLIGFDPRGVGRSSPVKCFTDADQDALYGYDPDPSTPALVQGIVDLNKKIGGECGDKYGDDLGLFSTVQAATDIDAIRAALGEQKLTYLGFSYGTLLGAVYAQLFPTHIRAMTLDGVVDPNLNSIQKSENQASGFERTFDDFTAWCKANSSCQIKADPRGQVMAALAAARAHPVTYGDRKATAGWVLLGVTLAMYDQSFWPYLGQAISDLKTGDARLIFALADQYSNRTPDGHYDSNETDAFITVSCDDTNDNPTVAQMTQAANEWRTKYPLFGTSLAEGIITCTEWPAKRDPYPTGQAKGAPPLLLVGTVGDPATPYENTQKLATMLGDGTVLTWQGAGHTAYPHTTCIRNAVEDYMINLTMPPAGTTCPAK